MDDATRLHITSVEAWCAERRWEWTPKAQGTFNLISSRSGAITPGELERAADTCPVSPLQQVGKAERSAAQVAYQLAVDRGINLKQAAKLAAEESRRPKAARPWTAQQGQLDRAESLAALKSIFDRQVADKSRRPGLTWEQVLEQGQRMTEEQIRAEAEQEMLDRQRNPEVAAAQLRTSCIVRMKAPKRLMDIVLKANGKPGGSLRMDPPVAAVTTWMDKGCQPSTLVISGPAEIGKTTASMLLLYAEAKKGVRQRQAQAYWMCNQLAGHCAAHFNDASRDVLASLYNLRVLVVDNLMPADGIDSALFKALRNRLTEVLDHRHTHQLPTIINTNESRETLTADYGQVFASYFYGERGKFVQSGPARVHMSDGNREHLNFYKKQSGVKPIKDFMAKRP